VDDDEALKWGSSPPQEDSGGAGFTVSMRFWGAGGFASASWEVFQKKIGRNEGIGYVRNRNQEGD